MNKRYIITATILAASFALASCGKEEIQVEEVIEEPALSPEELRQETDKAISTLIANKGLGRVYDASKALDNMKELDEASYDKWNEISNYWDEINEDNFLNLTELPEGLSDDNSMCIVVMGYCLNPDGSMRDELIGRLETAMKAAEKYPESYVLVTGGGTASQNPAATEADSMADWLKEQGLNADRIIVENKSRTSAENALFSYDILEKQYPEVKDIVIVTSDYHVPLGCILYNEQFILKESPLRVISNAGYISNNSYVFNLQGQADWIMRLYEIQPR